VGAEKGAKAVASGSKPVKRTGKQIAAMEEAAEESAKASPPAKSPPAKTPVKGKKLSADPAAESTGTKFPLWILIVGALVVVGGVGMWMGSSARVTKGGKGPSKKDTVKSGAMLDRREKLQGSAPSPRCVNTTGCCTR
jgi:hypothetical protein